MATHMISNIINTILVVISLALCWIIPRKLGAIGIFISHFAVFIAIILMSAISISIGDNDYPGVELHMGIVTWTIMINTILLPITIYASHLKNKEIKLEDNVSA